MPARRRNQRRKLGMFERRLRRRYRPRAPFRRRRLLPQIYGCSPTRRASSSTFGFSSLWLAQSRFHYIELALYLEFYVDLKAKLCLADQNFGMAVVPGAELIFYLAGYWAGFIAIIASKLGFEVQAL